MKTSTHLLWLCSELEAVFAKPKAPLRFRRRYLRSMGIKHGREIWIGKGLHVWNSGNLLLGERCALGAFVVIANHAPISIGDDFLSAPGLVIDSGSHDPATLEPFSRPITIGNRVWCGNNVTILSGVSIGDDVVIGAGSVVNKNIPPNCIAAGVPAKVLRPLERQTTSPLWTWTQ
jgi:acetyltransferase-like isoleucine patch superfamily enzyme